MSRHVLRETSAEILKPRQLLSRAGLSLVIVPLEAANDGLWAVPLLYLTDPGSLVIERHNMRVELESPMSRGCSVVDLLNRDRNGAMADIVMQADKSALARLLS